MRFFTHTVKLISKNQIVLSRQARESMKLKGNEELFVVVTDGIGRACSDVAGQEAAGRE